MPASQNRSNCPFRFGLLRLATTPTAKSGFKARKYERMRRTYWYAAMTEDAAQHSRWTFYEVVLFDFSKVL
jgi:hypothetical protein